MARYRPTGNGRARSSPRALAGGAPPGRDRGIRKCPTGIAGLDQITAGGLPEGRPTLVCGAAGCGKTLLSVEFLVRGATRYGEPGVFVAFEEIAEELAANVASLGFDLPGLVEQKLLVLDHIQVERSEIEETGEYDLEGLFVRLGHAIDSIGAKRVVLDTIESLFGGLSDHAVLRAELRRLFRWLKSKGVTAIITGERGEGQLTRQGLEEYVSDCVILLDNRVQNQISTRRLRIVKYRGSAHGSNEYPFLIDDAGIEVVPITALSLQHDVADDRVSTGVPPLDEMLAGGVHRGSSILISGTAGTGKSSLAASFAQAACQRGERCLYFPFEESAAQIRRNMRSIGLDLAACEKTGNLTIRAERPTAYGLEMHLALIHREIARIEPHVVVFDPLTSLLHAGTLEDAGVMLMRLIDMLKSRHITAVFTSLAHGGTELESTELGVSSLMDTWLVLRDIEAAGERNRVMYLVKSRGTAHSNQVREFLVTSRGIQLRDVYLGPGGVLTGSARVAQEARDQGQEHARQQQAAARRDDLQRRLLGLQAQAASVRADLESAQAELERLGAHEAQQVQVVDRERDALAQSRGAANGDARPATKRSPAKPKGSR